MAAATEAGGVIAKWTTNGQLSWYRALSVDTTDLIGHLSIRFGPLATDSIFICGLMNEPVIVEGTLYNLPHDNIAYAGLLIDTTYAAVPGHGGRRVRSGTHAARGSEPVQWHCPLAGRRTAKVWR